jgi:hypothetical protein
MVNITHVGSFLFVCDMCCVLCGVFTFVSVGSNLVLTCKSANRVGANLRPPFA